MKYQSRLSAPGARETPGAREYRGTAYWASSTRLCPPSAVGKAQTKATVRDFPQKPQISKQQQHNSSGDSLPSAQREAGKQEPTSKRQLQHRRGHRRKNHWTTTRRRGGSGRGSRGEGGQSSRSSSHRPLEALKSRSRKSHFIKVIFIDSKIKYTQS